MQKAHVLYNPLAGSHQQVRLLETLWTGETEFHEITQITNYSVFLQSIPAGDALILAGGDGTLNRFANDTAGINILQHIYYFPCGTGNDFAQDMGKQALCQPFLITPCLQNLPIVQVKGKTYRFLNGVGFGIDGYCCQEGDRRRQKHPGKKVNYTAIAIGGLLFRFQARNAKVFVDGAEHSFHKVWIAPTMFGRFYGGGMKAAPKQDRFGREGSVSVVLFHSGGRFRTLCAFPGIFKGNHIKNKKLVTVLTGKHITVTFDRPTPLQIDGETVTDVTEYSVSCP